MRESQELVSKLESDLENTSFIGTGQVSLKQKQCSPGSRTGSVGTMSAPDANLVALLASGDTNSTRCDASSAAQNPSSTSAGGGAGEGQMLAILTSQRDRYKDRLDGMEGKAGAKQLASLVVLLSTCF